MRDDLHGGTRKRITFSSAEEICEKISSAEILFSYPFSPFVAKEQESKYFQQHKTTQAALSFRYNFYGSAQLVPIAVQAAAEYCARETKHGDEP